MKAIVFEKYGPPEVLQLKEVEKPVPANNELLIRVCATAVNATDPITRKGEPLIARLGTGLTRPKEPIPGDVLAGEIEAVGGAVTLFQAGDAVYGTTAPRLGAHAEYLCLPEDGALATKPANMTYEEAAAVCDGALAALPFLRDKGKLQPGQQVLVNGASGSIGTFAVQLAKFYGAEVTGVCSTANVELVTSLGADQVIDYTREDFTRSGQAWDIIFDTVGKSSFSRCKDALAPGGVYLTTVPTLGILPQMAWTSIAGSKKAIFMATGLRPAADKAKDLAFLKDLVEAGQIRSVIDRRYPLEQIVEAHRYVEQGHKKGNVVLIVDPNSR
jgi:NADPH:quinone reductase-like Zn-dependent oxidoreductase